MVLTALIVESGSLGTPEKANSGENKRRSPSTEEDALYIPAKYCLRGRGPG